MKKYLSLAIVLGAAAFLSVSYLAQAQSEPVAAPAVAAPAAPAVAAPAAPAMPAPADAFAKDKAECAVLASAPTTEGAAPSEADKTAALHKCLVGKGHSEDEIMKAEATNAPAAPAPAAK